MKLGENISQSFDSDLDKEKFMRIRFFHDQGFIAKVLQETEEVLYRIFRMQIKWRVEDSMRTYITKFKK